MSNKNLLNESTIRKFMKLANMEPLAEEFVSTHLQTEDEEVELEELASVQVFVFVQVSGINEALINLV